VQNVLGKRTKKQGLRITHEEKSRVNKRVLSGNKTNTEETGNGAKMY